MSERKPIHPLTDETVATAMEYMLPVIPVTVLLEQLPGLRPLVTGPLEDLVRGVLNTPAVKTAWSDPTVDNDALHDIMVAALRAYVDEKLAEMSS